MSDLLLIEQGFVGVEIADFIDLFISLRMIRFINRVHTCHQSVPEAFNSANEVVIRREASTLTTKSPAPPSIPTVSQVPWRPREEMRILK
ncbi:hypothetical protein C0Q70_09441 [Pomacea canaliculata]|uniref:Uncharacterized protein n=1 Tax=Pomacea canaliculata TaxID=400727 RepID=A0A2T7P9T3_POMCA|nr:hypothetical protein C0Q70_09441 [Pomacea canaliculata]